jgi:hypothetical protein
LEIVARHCTCAWGKDLSRRIDLLAGGLARRQSYSDRESVRISDEADVGDVRFCFVRDGNLGK